jgi:CHAD domain-containing protein
VQQQ